MIFALMVLRKLGVKEAGCNIDLNLGFVRGGSLY